MGLFNKLKNALFEEEEIEIPIKETPENKKVTPVIKEDNLETKAKIKSKPESEKKNIDALLEDKSERDLFKAENTFKFPEFDEEEFKSSYKPPIEKVEKKETVVTPKESFERVKPITFEYDKKAKQTRKENVKKDSIEDTKTKKGFRPSPIISPVYGVLDKNYKKEDIITVKEEKPKKKFDVDAIRKKAFGTLEDDIERSFEEPKESFYAKDNENIEELLHDSADEKIDLSFESRAGSREARNEKHNRTHIVEKEETMETVPSSSRSSRHRSDENLENEHKELDMESDLQVLDEVPQKNEEQRIEEDTLENDLFDLIDSMYDSGEDEEE